MIPSYFIAHGAPSLVLDNNAYTKFLGSSLRGMSYLKRLFYFLHILKNTHSRLEL